MKKLSLLLLAALALGSCKKNDDNTPSTPTTPTNSLTAKSWRITAQKTTTTIASTPTTTDDYAASPACERDNFFKFNANKVAVYDEGASKCDTSDPQAQNGTWDLSSDNKTLTILSPAFGNLAIPFEVVALTDNTLQVRNTETFSLFGITGSSSVDVTLTAF
jgi:hypothetical protein